MFRPVAINVGVRDVEEAIRFYEAVFGVPLDVSPARDHARWTFGEGDSYFLFCDPSGNRVVLWGA